MKNLNAKGFTLVELLSVIVILSVVVLIATNAVIPAMTSAKKQVLATEANSIVKAAQTLYVKDGLSTSKCYSYEDIIKSGIIEKNDEAYSGSILIDVNDAGKYSYKIWLSNGTYMVDGATPDVTSDNVNASAVDATTSCQAS